MREHCAADLQDRLIRIEGPVKTPNSRRVLVIADDEEITNCSKIELVILPREVITAKLTLGHITGETITSEVFETTDVRVKLTAYVEEVSEV